MKKKRWLMWVVFVTFLLIAAGTYIYGVYRGWFLLNYPSAKKYPVRGVDVSHFQGEIDWDILSNEGIQFAYIKATEGSSHVDRKFAVNWQNARSTKLAAGAYHFFSFDSSGDTQADNVIAALGDNTKGMLPIVVDVEFYGGKKQNPPDMVVLTGELQVMLDRLEAEYGVKPIIYTTEDLWKIYIKDQFSDYPLWIRNVMTKPTIGADYPWIFWQYTNRQRLKGYHGDEEFIDMNVFAGTEEEWEEFVIRMKDGAFYDYST